MAEPAIALVSMPFVSWRSPSLQIGLLGAIARAHGFDARTFHLNLDFAALVGEHGYEVLCDFGRQPVGDWLFSVAAFGDDAPDPTDRLLDADAGRSDGLLRRLGWTREHLLRVRAEHVPQYLDWLIRLVDWRSYDVVGFTSTFQQNVASLALARRIKAVAPGTLVVFGGANVSDEMGLELLSVADWVDLVVADEADDTLPELLAAVRDGGDVTALRGVAGRRGGTITPALPRPLVTDLDRLPVPDYGEYFERARVLGLAASGEPAGVSLPFESSRGCWWGQKHHCTFCGLNGGTMPYRAKSPERTEAELDTLARRHSTRAFTAVDNILDPRYLRTLLPRLADRTEPYELFFEIKANLGRDEIRMLAQAGVREVQPGIESLSNHVLALMRKGVAAAQNVDVLRWCRYYGISCHWNILFGFPDETPEDYEAQARLMPALRHLEPPGSTDRIWMERYSPLFRDREAFPVDSLVPQEAYRYVYPATTDLARIAYFFDYHLERTLPDEAYEGVRREAGAWKGAWAGEPPRLEYHRTADGARVIDTREPADRARVHELEGPPAAVLALLMDRPTSAAGLRRRLEGSVPAARLAGALDDLLERGLALDDGRLLVATALPGDTEDPT